MIGEHYVVEYTEAQYNEDRQLIVKLHTVETAAGQSAFKKEREARIVYDYEMERCKAQGGHDVGSEIYFPTTGISRVYSIRHYPALGKCEQTAFRAYQARYPRP